MIKPLTIISIDPKRLHPAWIFCSALIGSSALAMVLLNALKLETPLADIPFPSIRDLKSFQEILQCSGNLDPMLCLKEFKFGLLNDIKKLGYSPARVANYNLCLDRVEANSNGRVLDLLLNIQSCHQVSSMANYAESLSPSFKQLTKVILPIFIFIIMQLVSLLFAFANLLQYYKSFECISLDLNECKLLYDELFKRYTRLQDTFSQVKSLKEDVFWLKKKNRWTSSKTYNNTSQVYNRADREQKQSKPLNSQTNSIENQVNIASPKKKDHLIEQLKHVQTFTPSKILLEQNEIENKCENTAVKERGVNSTKIVARVGSKVFDLSDNRGKTEWVNFCKSPQKKESASSAVSKLNSLTSSDLSTNIITSAGTRGELGFSGTKDSENSTNKLPTTISLFNKEGKQHRRIFVPGVGWKSAKKLQAENLIDNEENLITKAQLN